VTPQLPSSKQCEMATVPSDAAEAKQPPKQPMRDEEE